jgi:hypothetical protein
MSDTAIRISDTLKANSELRFYRVFHTEPPDANGDIWLRVVPHFSHVEARSSEEAVQQAAKQSGLPAHQLKAELLGD